MSRDMRDEEELLNKEGEKYFPSRRYQSTAHPRD